MSSVSHSPSGRLRIIVLGYVVRFPLGGLAWHYLQYVLGLARLGHEVWYLEDCCYFEEDNEVWTYDPEQDTYDDPAYGLRFIAATFDKFGIGDRWAYFDAQSSRWHGPCASQVPSICSSADVLINVSGANPLRAWLKEVPVRVFVDTDPVFTQILQLTNPINRRLAQQHNAFVTYGENIGTGRAVIPSDEFTWLSTRQPVVLDAWLVSPAPPKARFTTIGAWDSYKTVEHGGVRYGMKSQSFEPYLDLPTKSGEAIELSLFDPSALPTTVRNAGWIVSNAREPTRDPITYQTYIQQSRGEFSVAKHGYVVSNSGWFSERSAAYLASGRPAVIQDTAFSDWMETGSGVLAFSDLEEAAAAIDEVNAHYQFHCGAAREIAEEYFDSDKVLGRLLEDAFGRPVSSRPNTE